jgi:hypothetical protein
LIPIRLYYYRSLNSNNFSSKFYQVLLQISFSIAVKHELFNAFFTLAIIQNAVPIAPVKVHRSFSSVYREPLLTLHSRNNSCGKTIKRKIKKLLFLTFSTQPFFKVPYLNKQQQKYLTD